MFMAKVLEGAFDVGCGKNPIRGNLCAAALRELVSQRPSCDGSRREGLKVRVVTDKRRIAA